MRPYLELLRPANVVTAIADVLAGYAIAGWPHPTDQPWLLVATACLYGGGVVLNDFFDRRLDQIERPERPIPSGRVSATAAGVFGGALLLSGVAAASRATPSALRVAIVIALLVLSYDAWAKRVPFIGPLNMGACRGFNLMLGMAVVPGAITARWPLALISIVYIFAVTTLSRGEVHGGRRVVAWTSAGLMMGVIGVLVWLTLPAPTLLSMLVIVTLAGWLLPAFWAAARDPGPGTIRTAVKTGVLCLVLLDATLGSVYAGAFYALLIVSVAGVAWVTARVFAVT